MLSSGPSDSFVGFSLGPDEHYRGRLMAWIESHQTLARHPKTLRLASLLHVSKVTAVGHLHHLWWWALDYAQDGDLSGFDDRTVAEASEWRKDAGTFVAALINAKGPSGHGFLNDDHTLHDWDDYAGRLIAQRVANKERMKAKRAANVQRTTGARSGATVPNPTVPNPTEPEPRNMLAVREREPDLIFEAICSAYGIDWHDLTSRSRGVLNAARADLAAVGATPDEILRRAAFHRQSDLGTPTPSALAKHWPQLAHGPVTRSNGKAESAAERILRQGAEMRGGNG